MFRKKKDLEKKVEYLNKKVDELSIDNSVQRNKLVDEIANRIAKEELEKSKQNAESNIQPKDIMNITRDQIENMDFHDFKRSVEIAKNVWCLLEFEKKATSEENIGYW